VSLHLLGVPDIFWKGSVSREALALEFLGLSYVSSQISTDRGYTNAEEGCAEEYVELRRAETDGEPLSTSSKARKLYDVMIFLQCSARLCFLDSCV